MSIVWIRQVQHADEAFVAADNDVTDRLAHQAASPGEGLLVEVGAVGNEVAERLVEDLLGPLRLHQPVYGNADEHVAQGGGVEHVRVVQDDEGHQASPRSCESAASSSAAFLRFSSSARM